MHYISTEKFNEKVLEVNNKLFDRFSFVSILLNPRNKGEEHFTTLYSYHQDKNIRETASKSYKMKKSERLAIIKDSLAMTLGFNSYIHYMDSTQFNDNLSELTKIEDASFNYLYNFERTLESHLTKGFDFKEKPLVSTFVYWDIKREKEKLFLMGDYTTEDEFKYIYSFISQLDVFSLNNDSLNRMKYFWDMREEPDMYYLNDIEYFLKKEENVKYKFFEKVYYLKDILKVEKELNELSEDDFLLMLERLNDCLRDDIVRAIYLLRKSPDDPYIDFIRNIDI